MHRILALFVLSGLGLACSSTGVGTPGTMPGFDDQTPTANDQQPTANDQTPAPSDQQPAVPCDTVSTQQSAIAAITPILCAKALACGQPTEVVTDAGDQAHQPFWTLSCAALGQCVDDPTQCNDTGSFPTGVCLDQVTTCYQAIVDLLGCDVTDAQTQHLTPPPECAGVLQTATVQSTQPPAAQPQLDAGN